MTRSTKTLLRRARRPILILLSIPLLLLALRLAWGAYADHRLAEARRSAASRGHRVFPEQFTQPPIPEDQNAAPLILEAMHSLHLTAPQQAAINGNSHRGPLTGFRWSDAEKTDIRAAAAANAAIYNILDRARQRPQAQWPTLTNDDYRLFRQLTNFLHATAVIAHDDGNDEMALACLYRLSQNCARLTSQPGLIPHLVAVASASVTPGGVERIHASLAVPSNSPSAVTARALIADFLDDAPYDAQCVAAMEHEVATTASYAQRTYPATQAWLIRPAFTLAWAHLFDHQLRVTEALSAHSWQAITRFPDEFDTERNIDRVTYHGFFWTNSRAILLSYHSATDRHAAAILLAAALYRADHAGQNAPTLTALVPKYLPILPTDPFSLPDVPLHYRATLDFLVWSVGEDGVDDRGSTELLPHNSTHGRWRERDVVYGPVNLEPLPVVPAPTPPWPPGFPPLGLPPGMLPPPPPPP